MSTAHGTVQHVARQLAAVEETYRRRNPRSQAAMRELALKGGKRRSEFKQHGHRRGAGLQAQIVS